MAGVTEPALDPNIEIVDPHHHLMDVPGKRYLMEELLADVTSGHNILATVYIECGSMYRQTGPEAMKPLGEMEFVNGVAAMSASGRYGATRLCAGIVGFADLTKPDTVQSVIERYQAIAGERFRGLRQVSFWDETGHFYRYAMRRPTRHLLMDEAFRSGFRHLANASLTFDSCLLHSQFDELCDLADNFPEVTIIVDHLGLPMGSGPYASRKDEIFKEWNSSLRKLAQRSNIYMKIGGLGLPVFGFNFHERRNLVTSEALSLAWRPYLESCLEMFGSKRCMLESNFPEDRVSCTYHQIWNAFKRITKSLSEEEKSNLFKNTAVRAYGLRLN